MKKEIDETINNFRQCFYDRNYKEEEEVKITSSVDKSVVFVGSTISVLKPIMLNDNIDNVGNFLIQKSIRTRALKRIDIPEVLEWSSFFNALGVLVKYENIDNLISDTFDFFIDYEKIDKSDLLVRINSYDTDLLEALGDNCINIELDSMPPSYYKHKYGLTSQGIYGRNFNIAIKDYKDGLYKDVGNIIVIESDEKKYGVEFAIGANAIIMRKLGIKSSVEASLIADFISFDSLSKYKFADSVAVVANLAYENIESLKKDRSKIYLYRKYLKALKKYMGEIGISSDNVCEIIDKYLLSQYGMYDEEVVLNNIKVLRK